MEAGSSPTRITSSRTGTPPSLSSATCAATCARTSAATALPSRILATGTLEDREELGGDLLLAAHDAWQAYDPVLRLGVEGALDGGAVTRAQQLRAPFYDVSDHERREEVVVLLPQLLQGVKKLFLALQEAGSDRLHLRDAHLLGGLRRVLLGVAAHDLLRRQPGDVGGCLEHLHPELPGVRSEEHTSE